MPTAYTSILKLALPVTGELDGTWGDTVNDNITSMIEEAIAGKASVSSWTGASATLTTANGTTSQARCAILDCSGAPGANATVICPTATKTYVVNNQVSGGYTVTLKTSGGTGIAVPNGACMLLYCDGTNVVAGVSYVATAGAANSVSASAVTGTLGVDHGGTGVATITGIIKGNGTSAFSAAVSGTDIKTVNNTSLLGSGNITTLSSLVRSARTSNTILGAADQSTFVDVTTGGFTQTFTAAATLGSGWWCVYRNNSTTDVTLDPNSTETIDGLTSYVMYPGEARIFQCDGSNFYTVLLTGFTKTFTSSGTFTTPPGYRLFEGQLWSGGGGGRKDTNNTAYRHGGGGGACAMFNIPAASFGATETVTIGAGGSGQASTADGGDGGNSTLGALVTAYGGGGGKTSSNYGGSAFFNYVWSKNNYSGGLSAADGTAIMGTLGGGVCSIGVRYYHTAYGGGGGGTIDSDDTTVYNPSTYSISLFGGAGGNASVASSGSDGTAPGGGGGATKSGATSGAGARGELRIWGVL